MTTDTTTPTPTTPPRPLSVPYSCTPHVLEDMGRTLASLTNTLVNIRGVEQDANGDVMYKITFGVYTSKQPLLQEQCEDLLSAVLDHLTKGLMRLYSELKPDMSIIKPHLPPTSHTIDAENVQNQSKGY